MRRMMPDGASGPSQSDLVTWLSAEYAYPDSGLWLRANMVTSVDGAATVDERSGGLSGAHDQLLLHLLRALADVVVVGAATARREGYAGLHLPADLTAWRPQPPTLAIVTRTLHLPDALLEEAAQAGSLLVAPTKSDASRAEHARRLGVEVLEVPSAGGGVDLRQLLEELHARGLRRVLTEGGPVLLGQLLDADLVDEVCLTISPRIVGGSGTRIVHGAASRRAMRLDAVLADAEGFLFTRYRRHG